MIRKIYKFGGASVKDADAVRNLARIVGQHKDEDILLVVSAMGKTTNMLEKVLANFREHDGKLGFEALNEVVAYHSKIIQQLFGENANPAFVEDISNLFIELWDKLQQTNCEYDYQYDQTVCYGEIISTTIINEYLNTCCDIPIKWLDARQYVITEGNHRAANPDWDETRLRISKLNDDHIRGLVCLTQGFIGGTTDGKVSTTLGREGSDFTAAIFANCLDAEEVTIWKDVDGLLNADPKRDITNTVKIPHIHYYEAIELAFYGATIIHPKTIKPLQNKGIVLKVQSFLDPTLPPTIIDGTHHSDDENIPSYIVKDKQTLVSLSPRDFSFMNERNLKTIFAICDDIGIHANMIQTSALMLSFCFDGDTTKLRQLMACLKDDFSIKYNENLQLFTVRHYGKGADLSFIEGKQILLQQESRSTLQYVISC